MGALKIEVLEKIYVENSELIDIKNLSELIGRPTGEISKALKVDSGNEVNPSSNPIMKKWLVIFNLTLCLIEEGESNIGKEDSLLKMKRWLNAPAIEFGNEVPLDLMMKGKSRKVILILEQFSA